MLYYIGHSMVWKEGGLSQVEREPSVISGAGAKRARCLSSPGRLTHVAREAINCWLGSHKADKYQPCQLHARGCRVLIIAFRSTHLILMLPQRFVKNDTPSWGIRCSFTS
jgi:hypothetical protein